MLNYTDIFLKFALFLKDEQLILKLEFLDSFRLRLASPVASVPPLHEWTHPVRPILIIAFRCIDT